MVMSIGIEDNAPEFWKNLLLDNRLQDPLGTEGSDARVFLRDGDWLLTSWPLEELDAKRRYKMGWQCGPLETAGGNRARRCSHKAPLRQCEGEYCRFFSQLCYSRCHVEPFSTGWRRTP
jgi:hypothetical protein